MVKYLHGDGVDDYLRTPSMSFNRIVIDAAFTPKAWTRYVAINDSGFWRNGSNQDALDWKFNAIYKNTIQQSFNTTIVVAGQRAIFDLRTSSVQASYINFLTDYAGTGDKILGDIWNIKIYNGTTLQAHYDMSTGTVLDQSGNGLHATLTGGTWLDDGIGGTPVGTDGSITLGLTQQIYSDSSVNLGLTQQMYRDSFNDLSLTQQIYADISANLNLVQQIYRDTETLLGLNQSIYRDSEVNFNLSQTIYKDDTATLPLTQATYRDSELGLNLRQEIYREAESILNLIQEFYEESQTYITLQLIQQIYKDSSTDLNTVQSIYRDSDINFPLNVQVYEEKQTNLNLTQNVYKDDSSVLNLSQIIYRDYAETLNLVQQMYTEGEIGLPLLIQIRDDLVNLIGEIHLIGKRVLNVFLQGKRELTISLQGKRELNVTLKGGIDVTAINQNFSMIAGDTKNIVVTMPEDLTGCTAKWGMRQRVHSTENLLAKSTSGGITINGTEITIHLAPTDTLTMYGTYFHECEVTDQQNNVSTIFTGMASISRSGV